MTPAQLSVLDLVREQIDVAGVPPSYREIARVCGLALSRVQEAIDGLVEQGKLRRPMRGRRGALELGDRPDMRTVPTAALRNELARRGETLGALSVNEPRAYGRRPSCAADTCGVAVQRGHLFCRQHWFGLPSNLRERLLQSHSAAVRSRDPADATRFQELLNGARDLADGCGGAI